MNKKIYLTLCLGMMSLLLVKAQTKKSPYEGYGFRKDSATRYKLLIEYSKAYRRLDTMAFSNLVTEAATEDLIMDYRQNDSFKFLGRKPIDKNDSAYTKKFFDIANAEMDNNWCLNLIRKKSPGKVLYPAYKYIFKRVILPPSDRKTHDDSIQIYGYNTQNFSKFESFSAKVTLWYTQLYGIKTETFGSGTEMTGFGFSLEHIHTGNSSVKPLSYFKTKKVTPAPVVTVNKPKVNTRKVTYLKVPGRVFTLRIRDYVIEDGDIIDVYINGQIKYRNLKITSAEQTLCFKDLLPNTEYDVKIIVISEGTDAPCTVKGYIYETKEKFSIYGSVKEDLHIYVLTGK